jgi:PAS domain S-box-containing protein
MHGAPGASWRRSITRGAPNVLGTPIGTHGRNGLLSSAIAASAVAVVAVAVVLAVLAATLLDQRDSNARVRDSEQILRTASDAERAVVDMETGLRGYIITRDPTFLAPYRSGVRAANARTADLVALTAGQPAQQATARRVRGLVVAYVREYAAPVIALVGRAPVRARTNATTLEGKRRVDEIRVEFTRIAAVESARLNARTRSADRAARRAIVLAVGGLLVLLALAILFGAYVARRIARPVADMSLAAERMTSGDLTVRVPAGGAGELDRLSRAFNEMASSLAVAQEGLRRRAAELEVTGERTVALLDTVFEQAPVGLAVFDDGLRFVRANATLAAMDGFPEAEHLGRSVSEVLPGMAGALEPRLRDVLAERRAIADAEIEGTTRPSPDEERVWRASYFPIVLESGETIGCGAIFVDITEHRRATRERQRLVAAERLAAQRTARLQEVTGRLSRAVGPRDVAQVVVEQGIAALGAEAGVAVLSVPSSNDLQLAALTGYDERDALDWRDLALSSESPLAEAVRTCRVVRLGDRDALRERFPALAPVLERRGHGAWVAAPIAVGDEARGGVLFAFARERALSEDDARFLELLLGQAAQALDRAALYERQRHIASTLQRSLLPTHLPRIPGVELAAVYRPAGDGNEVGGDFYDVVPTTDGRFVVAIGDVEGKGPEAAALTGLVRHTLRAETLHRSDPAELVRVLNRVVFRDDTDRFCTVALAGIEVGGDAVRVRVACGGHLPPIVTRRDAAPAEIACRGTLLGVQEEIRVVVEEVELAVGDGLVLYTDGVLDAGAPARTLTATDLVELLAEAGARSPQEVAETIHDAAVGAGGAPRDDIAILALRVTAAPPVGGAGSSEPVEAEPARHA